MFGATAHLYDLTNEASRKDYAAMRQSVGGRTGKDPALGARH